MSDPSSPPPIVVVYHHPCPDGITAAWIFKDQLHSIGKELVRADEREIERILTTKSVLVHFEPNYVCRLASCDNSALISELGHRMLSYGEQKVDFSITYRHDFVRNIWKCSLRSEGSTNVADIASELGKRFKTNGGGHPNAAACEIPLDQLEVLFTYIYPH